MKYAFTKIKRDPWNSERPRSIQITGQRIKLTTTVCHFGRGMLRPTDVRRLHERDINNFEPWTPPVWHLLEVQPTEKSAKRILLRSNLNVGRIVWTNSTALNVGAFEPRIECTPARSTGSQRTAQFRLLNCHNDNSNIRNSTGLDAF